MILYQTFDFLKSQLNTYFRSNQRWAEDKAVLSAIVEDESTGETSDKLLLTLTQMSQESTLKNHMPKISSGGTHAKSNLPLSFNIDVLVSAKCSKYEESLKLISDAVLFFQANSFFDHTTHPMLSEEINKISMSILDIPHQELSHMWGMLGGKYLPSVVYRARTVTFDANQIHAYVPAVTAHDSNQQ